jgi:hypothetical protein
MIAERVANGVPVAKPSFETFCRACGSECFVRKRRTSTKTPRGPRPALWHETPDRCYQQHILKKGIKSLALELLF